MEQKAIGKSKEDYLKAILIIKKKHGVCRCVDISNEVNVSKASVSIAVKKLEQDGLVKRDDWRILLTESGQRLAESLYAKNLFFVNWLTELGVSEQTARSEACLIEHAISDETYDLIRAYLLNTEKGRQ